MKSAEVVDEEFIEIDENEDNNIDDTEVIFNYINENHLDIKEKKEDLINLVKYLQSKKISFRRMERVTKISREKLRKLSKL